MLITRKIGKILRGKATITQVMLAAVLGGMLGFVPGFFLPGDLGGGFMQAPGLILVLLFLVLVLNANLAVFGLVTLVAKLLSLVTLPVTFALGRWLLDGPMQGLFRPLVNGRVTAWFGLEHYATTGGVMFGAVFGAVLGVVFWKSLQGFRRKMAQLEEGSDAFVRLSSKKSTRLVTWLLFGGNKKGKQSYRELLEQQKKGLPIRIVGVAVVAVVATGLWLGHRTLAGPFARNALQTTLETVNGATADIAGVDLDLGAGFLKVHDVALADPSRLQRDSFRAQALEFDLGTGDLLRKRFVVEKVLSSSASHGLPRTVPGKRIGDAPAPPPPPGDGKTIDDYIKQAQVWKERLAQADEWLRKLSQVAKKGDETPAERDERIAREKQDGLTKVRATHLLEQTPLVLVKSLLLENVVVADMPDDAFDISASNLSSDPALLAQPMTLAVKSRSGRYTFQFGFVNGRAELDLGVKDIDADTIGAQLAVAGQAPMQGGKLDAALRGSLGFDVERGFLVDLPLQVALRGTTLSLFGSQPTNIDALTIPLGLRGPISNPRITLDDSKLADALVAAGRKELADQVRARAEALLKGLPMPGAGGALGGAVGDLIEGKKTPEQLAAEAAKLAEEEAKKRAAAELERQKAELQKKAEDELKKKLPGGIGDLLKKKKDG
jgi:uncharacterized protein (TIGR03546 family)